MSHMFYIKALNSHDRNDSYKLEQLQFCILRQSDNRNLSAPSGVGEGFHQINSFGEIAIPLNITGKRKDIENTGIFVYVRSPSSGLIIQRMQAFLREGLSMSERFYYKVPTYSIKNSRDKNKQEIRTVVNVTVYMGRKKDGKKMVGQKIHMEARHKIGSYSIPNQIEYSGKPLVTDTGGKVSLTFSYWNSPCTIKIWHEQSGKWILPRTFTLERVRTDYIYEITEWQEKKSETKPLCYTGNI